MRLRGTRQGALGAGSSHIGDDWVGAHGESTDGICVDVIRFQQLEDGVSGETTPFGVQRRGAAIDVIVAGASGGKLELAEAEAGAREEREKVLCVSWFGHQGDCSFEPRRRERCACS